MFFQFVLKLHSDTNRLWDEIRVCASFAEHSSIALLSWDLIGVDSRHRTSILLVVVLGHVNATQTRFEFLRRECRILSYFRTLLWTGTPISIIFEDFGVLIHPPHRWHVLICLGEWIDVVWVEICHFCNFYFLMFLFILMSANSI